MNSSSSRLLLLFLLGVSVHSLPVHEAALRVFNAKLEKDSIMWVKYCAALSDYTSSQRVGKVEFLRAQDRQLAEAIERQADSQFPVKSLPSAEGVAPYVSTCASAWFEKQVISTVNQFTVYIVNLTALGNTATRALREVTRIVADACAHCPERTCGIIISPNVASYGVTYDEMEILNVQDETETFVRQPEYNLRVRRGQFVFKHDSINSRTRSCVHPLLMCISDQANVETGELVSLFAASQLWHRRAVIDIKMKPNNEYVVPVQGQTAISVENLSKSQLHKQHISGVDLVDKLKESLWKGMNLSQQHGAMLVDLLPYDDSIIMSTVQGSARARPKEPQEMVATCCWARGDQDADIRKKNATWLSGVSHRGMERLVRQKLLCLQGFTLKEYQAEAPQPSTDPSHYHLTFPTAEGSLALRQSALDEWAPKFARLKTDFEAVMDKHNKAFNSSGCPYKADGRKRNAEGAEMEEDGESFPDDCVVESLEALGKQQGALSTVHSRQPELFSFVFTSKGHLYVHALEDGIMSAKKSLFQIFGEYHTGDAEIAKATKRKALLYTWKMESGDYEAVWGHPSSWDPPFQKSIAKFRQFVDYLAEHNVVTFDVACHEVSGEEPNQLQVKEVESCAFEPKKLPGRTVADLTNCGSLMHFASVDWAKGETTDGTMRLCMALNYEDTQQQKGIFPSKPCWMLTKPKRIVKGKCFRLCEGM